MAVVVTVNRRPHLVAHDLSYDDVVGLVYHNCPINFVPVVSYWVTGDQAIHGTMLPGDKVGVFTGVVFKVEPPPNRS
jgi:hypothetical protein